MPKSTASSSKCSSGELQPPTLDCDGTVRGMVATARRARLASPIDSCKAIEKRAFRLAELARESSLPFLTYLFDMARLAAVDERMKIEKSSRI